MKNLVSKSGKIYNVGDCFATQGKKKSPIVITSIRLLNEKNGIYSLELIGVRGGIYYCHYNNKLGSIRWL